MRSYIIVLFITHYRSDQINLNLQCTVRNSRNLYDIFIETPVRERPLGERKWEHNIKTNLIEMGCEDVKWIDLFQDTV
jgi:hypothetical protein